MASLTRNDCDIEPSETVGCVGSWKARTECAAMNPVCCLGCASSRVDSGDGSGPIFESLGENSSAGSALASPGAALIFCGDTLICEKRLGLAALVRLRAPVRRLELVSIVSQVDNKKSQKHTCTSA